jgi:drug/metabolite transporter (DMT)-like permease
MVVIFGRMLVAGVCFAALSFRFRKVRYRRGDWKPILFMLLCEPCLYFVFEAQALRFTSASQAGMITALLPLLVAVNARVFLKETISARSFIGFVTAIVGAVWLSVSGKPSANAPNPILGNFLEFVAMVCATGYIITLKHLTSRYSPFFITALQAWAGSLFFLPLVLLPTTTLPVSPDPTATLAVVYLGAFVTLGAYGLYNFGVSRIPVSQASAFINLIPAFTVILGWMVLGERFTPPQYLAAILIFIGIYISQDSPPPRIETHPDTHGHLKSDSGRPAQQAVKMHGNGRACTKR